MDYPVSSLVTQPSALSQRQFAEEASKAVKLPPEHAYLEVSDEGLRMKGVTEFDLEVAFDELRKLFPSARRGKPEVAYVYHPKFMEPCYVATLRVLERDVASVLADLRTRRGVILSVKQLPEATHIIVDLPVSETFGYFTTLRSLTQGKGTYTVSVGALRTAGSSERGNDAA